MFIETNITLAGRLNHLYLYLSLEVCDIDPVDRIDLIMIISINMKETNCIKR